MTGTVASELGIDVPRSTEVYKVLWKVRTYEDRETVFLEVRVICLVHGEKWREEKRKLNERQIESLTMGIEKDGCVLCMETHDDQNEDSMHQDLSSLSTIEIYPSKSNLFLLECKKTCKRRSTFCSQSVSQSVKVLYTKS